MLMVRKRERDKLDFKEYLIYRQIIVKFNIFVSSYISLEIFHLFGACILGHGLSTFGYSVFSQLSRKNQANRCLNFTWWDSRTFVVFSQTRCLLGDTLEDVIDKRVHDGHCLWWDSSIWMNLLENSIDVNRVWLLSWLLSFLLTSANSLDFLNSLFGPFSRWLWWWCHNRSSII